MEKVGCEPGLRICDGSVAMILAALKDHVWGEPVVVPL